MDPGRTQAIVAACASALLVFGVAGVVAAPVGASPLGPPPTTLNVHCWPSGFSTIGAAVEAAHAGDVIRVCAGTYDEDVVVPPSKQLTLEGIGNPVIDATGFDNGIQVLASNSVVEGFTVEQAIGEGILVQGAPGNPVVGVTVSGNTVESNDQGNPTGAPQTDSSYPECNGSAEAPGDCGEGIHLMVADDSSVVGNQVSRNSGGILLTDEFGPTDGNEIAFNSVSDNAYDCGITLAGHNPGAFADGRPQPTVGGVFSNRIVLNSVSSNGVAGQGAGVLMATPFPGGAVYNNLVQANTIWGNGLAGVTVHSHAPGQDVNGNFIEGNRIGTNNLDGDFDFSPSVDPSTTGVTVAAVAPLTVGIQNNIISSNVYGIWTMPAVTITGVDTNQFIHVTTPLFVG
ncbi:MAG: nitrous oxide reductase family maturation protein NosD [Acidimicrobiales bacterium]